jgi:rhamnogalacturonan acetylesterase
MRTVSILVIAACVATVAWGAAVSEPNKAAEAPKKAVKHPDPAPRDKNLPTLFLVGDSTVKNGGPGEGWGDHLAPYFDENRINVVNWALGGRSTRSFIQEGRWKRVLAQVKPGDYILLQLGHNDSKPLTSNRGTVRGIGDDVQDANDEVTGDPVKVHTYGWYLGQYVKDAAAKKATLIFLTPVPRENWDKEGKLNNGMAVYADLMKKVAVQEKITVVDLNAIVAGHYNELGKDKVVKDFFSVGDHTHTSLEGAKFNAGCVVEGLKGVKECKVVDYLKKQP